MSASRREVLRSLSAGALVAGMPGLWQGCAEKAAPRPNILFIMADDHASQAISAYGSRLNQTPNIDRLAQEGMRVNHCFATNGICAPSRASILTGTYSHINGVIDNNVAFDGDQVTFPGLLGKAGYQTALFGKWHLKSLPTCFDHYDILPGQGHYYNPDFIRNGERRQEAGYVTDITTDLCLDWLEKRSPESPFCVMLHHKAPHRNWMPAQRHLHLFEDIDLPLPETFDDDYATRCDAAREQDMSIEHTLMPGYDLKADAMSEQDRNWFTWEYQRMTADQRRAWDAVYGPRNREARQQARGTAEEKRWRYQRYIKDYLRCIQAVDENVGRVLDYLEEKGLAENTLVIYTSDQGFFLGEHGWFDKRFMYEEALRMPCLVRYPAEIKAGSETDCLASNVDFAPTFLHYAGVDVPAVMQGHSLRAVLKGRIPFDWRQSVYYHYFEYPGAHSVKRHYGLRTQRYKLIHFYHDIDAWELYDLQNDALEVNNLAGQASHKKILKRLQQELKRLRRVHRDDGMKRFLPGKPQSLNHLAVGADVSLTFPPAPRYDNGADGLVNGVLAPEKVGSQPDYAFWQGFEGVDLDATLDLGKVNRIKQVSAGFLHHPGAWIFLPRRVEVTVSADGVHWLPHVVWEPRKGMKGALARRESITLETGIQNARYVRLIARSQSVCPADHPGAGRPCWLFVDEVAVK